MKILTSTFAALFVMAAAAVADLPVKPPLTRYSGLWNNSPFTAKPPPGTEGPVVNPLDDYALIGVSSIGGSGYRVTLINKKKPDERITVDSDNPKSPFKILLVTRKSGDPLGTVVTMLSGSMKGTVSFDEKLLTLVAAAPPKPAPVQPGQPGQPPQPNQPPNPNGQPIPVRQPRPRVVPPPNPQVPTQPQPNQPQNNPNIRPQRRGN